MPDQEDLIERLTRAGQAYAAADAAREEALAVVGALAREAHGTVSIAQIAELGNVSRPTVYKMLADQKS
jgi:Mn-dependent DtxR family transcriptional regulator